ncbi:MAG: flavodoxin family protein [Candidatus Bathyarchaeota archaeon]|nr:flavodoxin family protein [Candidatus Bathyarchaeota archaeon]
MKIIGIVGSPRTKGNTETLTRLALEAAAKEGVETELITLAGKDIQPCDGCRACRQTGTCHINDDLPPIREKMLAADGIILATPVYFGSATPQIKAVIDRSGYSARRIDGRRPFENKVGGPIVVARRAGQNFTYAQLMFFFMITGMIVPGSTYWNIAFGREKDDVIEDEEGVKTITHFGKKLAWLAKKIAE